MAQKNSTTFKAPKYNDTTLLVVVVTVKILLSLGFYLKYDGNLRALTNQITQNLDVYLRYLGPAVMYAIYDLLTFINLSNFDPVTYSILMQLRLISTGLLWAALFKKPLNRNQWISVVIITIACMLKESGKFAAVADKKTDADSKSLLAFGFAIALILTQIACGVSASVFNELLLKTKERIPLNLANLFMYTHALWIYLAILTYKGELVDAVKPANLAPIFSPFVLPIVLIMAFMGLVTSVFLKHLDSVRKGIASAIEIFIDALLTWLLFSIPLTVTTVLAAGLASTGVYLYITKPPTAPEKDAGGQDQQNSPNTTPGGSDEGDGLLKESVADMSKQGDDEQPN